MSRSDVIERTEAHVRSALEKDCTGHDWWHVDRVRRLALWIGAEEGADPYVVELAALLHDLADWKFSDNDETAGPREARAWLESLGVEEATTSHVCEIIAAMPFRGARVSAPMPTLEGCAVQDADRLDAMGAVGVARAFAYGGHKGQPLWEPGRAPVMHESFDAYKTTTTTTVNHFHEKLLLLQHRMNTHAGRRIAAARHRRMEWFLEQLMAELEGERVPDPAGVLTAEQSARPSPVIDQESERRDAFGFNETRFDRWVSLFDWHYRHWLRVETRGLENVPADSGALLVSSHAPGLSGLDAVLIQVAVRRHHPARRVVRGLHHRGTENQLLFGFVARQYAGTVMGHPRNADHLLRTDQLVLTFPEGGHAAAKPWGSRFELCAPEQFGTGFVRTALRAGVPVIPVTTTGVERAFPTLFYSRFLGRRFHIDGGRFPVTPQALAMIFAPFLTVFFPLPTKCRISFGHPIDLRRLGPQRIETQDDVFKTAMRFRELLQAQLTELASAVA